MIWMYLAAGWLTLAVLLSAVPARLKAAATSGQAEPSTVLDPETGMAWSA